MSGVMLKYKERDESCKLNNCKCRAVNQDNLNMMVSECRIKNE